MGGESGRLPSAIEYKKQIEPFHIHFLDML